MRRIDNNKCQEVKFHKQIGLQIGYKTKLLVHKQKIIIHKLTNESIIG